MFTHLRACLWLLVFTVVLCSGLYPLALWAVGQTLFPSQAEGSLLYDKSGKAVGSRLIAQEFKSDEFFWARPSAASYNGAASGASNWGPSNPALRDRVAKSVASLTVYRAGPKKGQPVALDVVRWVREQPELAARWAKEHPTVGPDALKVLQKAEPDSTEIAAAFFDAWRQAHPDAELEPVPADLVMASASGLDPHLTLEAARFQLDRVAGKWAERTQKDPAQVRAEIETILRQHTFAPLGGLFGVEMINVLEVNLALREKYQ